MPTVGLTGKRARVHAEAEPGFFTPSRRFDPDNPELLDRPGMGRTLLRDELQTLEVCNRRLGGHDLVLHYLERSEERRVGKEC